MRKIIFSSIVLLLCAGIADAQIVTPKYFGPNAFQVPEILEGRTSSDIVAEVGVDYFRGRVGERDNTWNIYLKAIIPLFTDRVNLSVWWAAHEWYDMSPDVMEYRQVEEGIPSKHATTGVLYVSTDILAFRETQYIPGVTIRVAMRTASDGRTYESRMSYDCAGYFLDMSVGKSFGPVRLSAGAGFLCWQTRMGHQNDAFLYGVKASYENKYFDLAASWGGYRGCLGNGDKPMSLRAHADFGPKTWYVRPFFEYQRGIKDWPFDQYRIGVKFSTFSLPGSPSRGGSRQSGQR